MMQAMETGTRAEKPEALVVEHGPRMVVQWTQAVEPGFWTVDRCLDSRTGGSSDETRGSGSGTGDLGMKLGAR